MNDVFSLRLRQAREMRGLSQLELGEKASLQSSAISHFESGRRSPSFDNLRKLADALNVQVDFLLGRVDQASESGPEVQRMYRHLNGLTDEDRMVVEQMAKFLANRQKNQKGEEP